MVPTIQDRVKEIQHKIADCLSLKVDNWYLNLVNYRIM